MKFPTLRAFVSCLACQHFISDWLGKLKPNKLSEGCQNELKVVAVEKATNPSRRFLFFSRLCRSFPHALRAVLRLRATHKTFLRYTNCYLSYSLCLSNWPLKSSSNFVLADISNSHQNPHTVIKWHNYLNWTRIFFLAKWQAGSETKDI